LADGCVHPDCVVDAGGSIHLQVSASKVQAGLRYTSRARTLSIEAGGADGPAQGKTKRIVRIVLRFFQSLGIRLGSDSPGISSYPEPFRTAADDLGSQIPLYNGAKRFLYEGNHAIDGQVWFETDDPLPCNITLLVAHVDTEEG
jgi:hypothetical protein